MGTFLRFADAWCAYAVHPHARGDIAAHPIADECDDGTPPRTWGHCASRSFSFATTSVHPHARGDIIQNTPRFIPAHGTPPRTWGHLDAVMKELDATRYTPTHVGTLQSRLYPPDSRPVHPHARGDISIRLLSVKSSLGTPPRTWGHLMGFPLSMPSPRYTPTHVGTLYSLSGRSKHSSGTPPRTWGHLGRRSRSHLQGRYTPTHVGTFSTGLEYVGQITVHPHARGDIHQQCMG